MIAMEKSQRGFTLIEVITTLVVLSLLGMGAANLLANVAQGMLQTRNATAAAENIQAALTRITHELANMDSQRAFTISASSATYYYKADVAQTTIQLSGTNLQLNGNTLLNNVTAFALARAGNSIDVTVSMTVRIPTLTGTTSKVYATVVNLNTQRFQ